MKRFTEEQFNALKKMIQKHPTLTQKEISKLFGTSERTVSLVNTSENFDRYKEKVRSWNHKKPSDIDLQIDPGDQLYDVNDLLSAIQSQTPEEKIMEALFEIADKFNQIASLIEKRS